MPERIAVYPGSFDPITNGHLNIIERCTVLFDKIIVAVANNSAKNETFSGQERVDLIRQATAHLPTVEVDIFDGLLVDYMRRRAVKVVIRGLRAISDFEYEFQIAHINRRLADQIDTLFMMTSEEYFYVSSSIVKEVASYNGEVRGLVPPAVEAALRARYTKRT
jgi:pantetheine-phosphate adenylyltransferase